jgi:hypothetical protein
LHFKNQYVYVEGESYDSICSTRKNWGGYH